MAIKLYMDVHIKRQITEGLRRRGVDNSSTLSDKELLDRAKILGRVLVTEDVDLIKEADRRLKNNEFLLGLIYLPQSKISIGRCIEELELLAKILEPEDFYNQIIFLPLKWKALISFKILLWQKQKWNIYLDEKGIAWIEGTGIKVIEIVLVHIAYGWSPNEIKFQYPHLSLSQIYSALAYYWDNKDTIDSQIKKETEEIEKLMKNFYKSSIYKKIWEKLEKWV